MKINILTIFPEIFKGWMETGMIAKAIENKLVEINVIDIREYTTNKHRKVDDYPFGGFDGMLMQIQPLDDAMLANQLENTHTIFPSPKGRVFNQEVATELSKYQELTFVAGRYEGVDQRFIDTHVDEMISMGDYILTGGELPICSILDAVIRLLPGVLNNDTSAVYESFYNNLLEFPQYTRPREYKGMEVPEVLLNGNHKEIEKWCHEQQISETKKYRPDLYQKYLENYDKNDEN